MIHGTRLFLAAALVIALGGPPAIAQHAAGTAPDRSARQRGPQRAEFEQRQLRGDIVAIKQVPIRQTDIAHVVAQLQTERGDRTIVDLGPASKLRDVRLRSGDTIRLTGRAAQVGDFRIIVAERLRADGQTVTIRTLDANERNPLERVERGRYSRTGRPPDRTVTVIASGMDFEPSRIDARPGEKLLIQLINKGEAAHNIEFELPTGEVELDENVAPGRSGSLMFVTPAEPGSYTFYCPVANHHERGMQGKLIIGETRSARRGDR
jgi:plastocyanin